MSIAHSPVPFRVDAAGSVDDIIAADGTHVVCFGHGRDEYGYVSIADAEFIVRACNNHEALLAALTDIVDDLEARWDMRDPTTNPGIKNCVEQAKAAIANAEAEWPTEVK